MSGCRTKENAYVRLFYFSAICQTIKLLRFKARTQSHLECWKDKKFQITNHNDQNSKIQTCFGHCLLEFEIYL